MPYSPINLQDKLTLFTEHWSPKIIAQMNDYHFKLAKVQGELTWHKHPTTDELFLVLKGTLRIDFRDGFVELQPGELFVVPKGTEHITSAVEECHLLFVDPAGEANTGDAGGEKTAQDQWI
ncbi:cupin [Candidatus Wirthbacteria bacterium CG2_30_54_11]|uniref:Cupin n=1 Tax=Candidatus Wirthbacteria bacterium CG2_30_54_11 TaxID=1817892 RepID=A0A1J5J4W5_9BACT|nr:MAG: cupin [Candidatus Wirthbacteria bacterium CG2_30_54_11]